MTQVQSAGGILLNLDKTQLYAIHKLERDEWALPKGKLKEGESLLDCAYREVSEETGFISFLVDENARQFENKFTYEQGGETFDKTTIYFIFQIRSEAQVDTREKHIEGLEGKWVTPTEFEQLVEATKTHNLISVIREAREYFRH